MSGSHVSVHAPKFGWCYHSLTVQHISAVSISFYGSKISYTAARHQERKQCLNIFFRLELLNIFISAKGNICFHI